jgi:regulator of protease activity HflC (stomatin/prohibitin superfamily)
VALFVQVDTVVYFQVTDARAVSYGVANPLCWANKNHHVAK